MSERIKELKPGFATATWSGTKDRRGSLRKDMPAPAPASMGGDTSDAVKKRLAAQLRPAATILGNTLG